MGPHRVGWASFCTLLLLIQLCACQVSPQAVDTVDPSLTPRAVQSEPTATEVRPTPEPTQRATAEALTEADADVLYVRAILSDDGTWTFEVTVFHEDTGWEDYADGWDVMLPDGSVVKPDADSPYTRVLLHPHENEQPFTRSQDSIGIPTEVTEVVVRAHDLVDGFGGREVTVDLMVERGSDFVVVR